MKKEYISKEERKKCAAVKAIFDQALADDSEIFIADAENYGYVILAWYDEERGFDSVETYTEAEDLFQDLLERWETLKLYEYAETGGYADDSHEEMISRLTAEQKEVIRSGKEALRKEYEKKIENL